MPSPGSSDVLLVSPLHPLSRYRQDADVETAGVATEVELGRLEGGEAGLRQIEGTIFTDPAKAETFLKECVLLLWRVSPG